jgi:hypothetical protein
MKQEILNLLQDRSSSEHNDCTVRALALTAKINYSTAHWIARTAGRKNRKGFYSNELLQTAKTKFKLNYQSVKVKPMTVATFCKKYPRGSYYCNKRGHAFAVIDGICYDHTKGGSHIRGVWEFITQPKYANPW